ncbi:hypothetical protein [Mesonia aquimarina]|nr:hypothetical protein [Mesonia aquimarina]
MSENKKIWYGDDEDNAINESNLPVPGVKITWDSTQITWDSTIVTLDNQ